MTYVNINFLTLKTKKIAFFESTKKSVFVNIKKMGPYILHTNIKVHKRSQSNNQVRFHSKVINGDAKARI